MLASKVALFGLTGSPEIFVFHTSSAGNAGQSVPGITVPGDASEGCDPVPDAPATEDVRPLSSAVTTISAEAAVIGLFFISPCPVRLFGQSPTLGVGCSEWRSRAPVGSGRDQVGG